MNQLEQKEYNQLDDQIKARMKSHGLRDAVSNQITSNIQNLININKHSKITGINVNIDILGKIWTQFKKEGEANHLSDCLTPNQLSEFKVFLEDCSKDLYSCMMSK